MPRRGVLHKSTRVLTKTGAEYGFKRSSPRLLQLNPTTARKERERPVHHVVVWRAMRSEERGYVHVHIRAHAQRDGIAIHTYTCIHVPWYRAAAMRSDVRAGACPCVVRVYRGTAPRVFGPRMHTYSCSNVYAGPSTRVHMY
jgi:hypothetical protein